MKYVPQAITRTVGRTVLRTQKNAPQLLLAAGVGGVITATVLACRATLRVEQKLDDIQKDLIDADNPQVSLRTMSEKEHNKMVAHIYAQGVWDITKLYAPAILVGSASIYCLTKSNRILSERNAQLTAAYVGLQQFLESYRGRVREKIGTEEERNVYYASTPVELVEDGPNGPKKIFGSAPGQRSPYSAIFDEHNGNWQEAHEYNIHWIRIQQQLLTDKLRAQGSLMLNEVYDRLDLPRTPNGAITGWMVGHKDSDDFVEIEVLPLHDFHGTLMLDFNVGGVVYDMLHGRASGR